MTAAERQRTTYIPIAERDPSTVRAIILARSSSPSAKATDMTSQVERSRSLLERMGWRLVADAYAFCESATGMRGAVRRPVLDEVLRLAASGQIDVIVCAEPERIARVKMRRYQAIQTALDVGCEFRFSNFPPDGRLPDDPSSRMYLAFLEEFAQAEAEKITDRLGPEKQRRYELGLPHGGVNGPLWGYLPGERRLGKHGAPKGLLSWVVDGAKAPDVVWLFETVAATPAQDFSLRGLTATVERRGIPTPTGAGRWSSGQVRNVLTNPKYCGQGKNLRWQTVHVLEQDADSHEVVEVTRQRDRLADAARWQGETYAIPAEAIPPLVSVETFERVQTVLAEARRLRNRPTRRRSDPVAHAALCDGGYAVCAECGGRMSRWWHARDSVLFYDCNKRSCTPSHPHKSFHVPARAVDAEVIRQLAHALTDPEDILRLADAAEAQIADATVDARLGEAALAAATKRLADLGAQRQDLLAALDALGRIAGMDNQLAEIRQRLTRLDAECAEATEAARDASPRHDRAVARAAFLRAMFTQRTRVINFALAAGATDADDDPWLDIGTHMECSRAAALLGVTEEALQATGIPIEYDRVDGDIERQVATEQVVRLLLTRLPRDRFRAILRDFGATVYVKRGRARADWLRLGSLPMAERVTLQLLGTVQIGGDGTNLSSLSPQVT
jgi:DNA invertase Pin-like site-specific DNA recombinase